MERPGHVHPGTDIALDFRDPHHVCQFLLDIPRIRTAGVVVPDKRSFRMRLGGRDEFADDVDAVDVAQAKWSFISFSGSKG
jgi:hypothetical protein